MTRVKFPTSARARLTAIGVVATLAVGGVAITSPAWAGSASPSTGGSAAASKSVSPGALKDRVDHRIDKLVAAVDRVGAAVPKDPNLTAAEKATAATDLSAARAGLTDLKARVDAETTVSAIKADVKAARMAARTNPTLEQAALLVRGAADGASVVRIDRRVPAIQAKIDAARAAGKDVTAAQNALNDIKPKAADAKTQLTGFGQALLSAQPPSVGFPAATTTIKAVGVDLKAIRADVKILRQAAGKASPAKS